MKLNTNTAVLVACSAILFFTAPVGAQHEQGVSGGGVGGISGGAGSLSSSPSSTVSQSPFGDSENYAVGTGRGGSSVISVGQGMSGSWPLSSTSNQEQKLDQRIQAQMSKLKEASSDDRAELESGLQKTLEALFDARTTRREEEIKSLEKRVSELRRINDERIAKRGEIISLKLKSVINQALGLGF